MQKIIWKEPDNSNITKVEISRSPSETGEYIVIATINATSDGLPKSSSNVWITSYYDITGTEEDWYKLRFYDVSTDTWSDYTEPFNVGYHITLCDVNDVKKTLNTVGRWSDTEIYDTIVAVDDLIYIECGMPIECTKTPIGEKDGVIQNRYYVGEENIYRIDRVFYGDKDKIELYPNDQYIVSEKYGMIEILPPEKSGITLELGKELEIRYVPRIYHKLSLYRTCKSLLEQLDFISNGEISKELNVINARLREIETLLNHKYGLQVSSMNTYYDPVYGTNCKKVVQDFRRNAYIGGDSSKW